MEEKQPPRIIRSAAEFNFFFIQMSKLAHK